MGRGIQFSLLLLFFSSSLQAAQTREQYVRETKIKLVKAAGGAVSASGVIVGENISISSDLSGSVNFLLGGVAVQGNGIFRSSKTVSSTYHVMFNALNISSEKKIAKGAAYAAEGLACLKFDKKGTLCHLDMAIGEQLLSSGMKDKVDALPYFNAFQEAKTVADATDGHGSLVGNSQFVPLAPGTETVDNIQINRDLQVATGSKNFFAAKAESKAKVEIGLVESDLNSLLKLPQIQRVLARIMLLRNSEDDQHQVARQEYYYPTEENQRSLLPLPRGISSEDFSKLSIDFYGTPIGVAKQNLFNSIRNAYRNHFGTLIQN